MPILVPYSAQNRTRSRIWSVDAMLTLCRWGLLSTAAISRKNWKSIALSAGGTITAVASRNVNKAQRFIDECSAEVPMADPPAAVGDYDSLLARADVDAVYIALPTAIRKEWVIKAAQAGKHVLCEKPIASTAQDAAEMLEACQRHRVQFIDGVMFSHSDRLAALRKAIDGSDGIGKLRRISSSFCFHGDESFQRGNIRVHSQLEPHGCLGDLGWYNLRMILWVMQYRMPHSVVAHTHKTLQAVGSPQPVPAEFSAELFFDDEVSAQFFCSFLVENQQLTTISGERGYITLEDFVLPFYDAELSWQENRHVLEIDNCRWNMRRHQSRRAVVEYSSGEANSQEVKMISAMNRCVLSGNLEPHWHSIALKTQTLLDACRNSADQNGRRIELSSS
jgi:predicted dehydrogenase